MCLHKDCIPKGALKNEHQPTMPCSQCGIWYLKFIHVQIVAALSETISLAYISKLAVLTAPTALMSWLHRGERFVIFLSAKAYVDLIEKVMKIFMAVLTLTAIFLC